MLALSHPLNIYCLGSYYKRKRNIPGQEVSHMGSYVASSCILILRFSIRFSLQDSQALLLLTKSIYRIYNFLCQDFGE